MLRLLAILFLSGIALSLKAQNDSLIFLKVGDKAPVFKVLGHDSTVLDLEAMFSKGKVVLVFYRGGWCPYCNRHMSDLQDSLSLITEKGASLIAITPETETSIDQSISKTNASFEIIHDSAYVIMKAYGVAFKVNELTIKKYKLLGIDLDESNGNTDHILPVPATVIINRDGTIAFIHFDENYKNRLSVKEILNKL